ncbi:MAG: hypothetical protein ACOYKD_04195 [Anaerolineaceae bacterium]|jgi:hypothetical protein
MKFNLKQQLLRITFTLLLFLSACNHLINCDSEDATPPPAASLSSTYFATNTPMFFINDLPDPTPIGSYDVDDYNTNTGIERGNILISALEAYIEDHLEPPQALIELVPTYINQIPSAPVGSFFYLSQPSQKIVANEMYTLSFERNKQGLTCEYLRYLRLWDCGYFTPEQLRTLTPP